MTPVPAALAWTRRLETLEALDPVVRAVRPLADALVGDPARRDLLRGAWLGHPLHPVLTDLPIGLLDLRGGPGPRRRSPGAARRAPGWSGSACWPPAPRPGAAGPTGPPCGRERQRVGVVHAATNGLAVVLFAVVLAGAPPRGASVAGSPWGWLPRRRSASAATSADTWSRSAATAEDPVTP